MSTITTDQVAHIAGLARLHIEEAKLEGFTKEMQEILQYIDVLQEVDTSSIAPLFQSTGQTNALREDVITNKEVDNKDLLSCSPLPIIDHQIQTPSAHN